MKFTSSFFRTQPRIVEAEEHGEPYQRTVYVDEPPHRVRSVGNSVGLPAFRNTNRPKPEYLRKANRRARRLGFDSMAHMLIFKTLITAAMAKRQEEENAG